MPRVFRLYWLREDGCDAGTPLGAGELDPAIRERVKALAGEDEGETVLRLPFLDRREWKRRAEVLHALELVRDGDSIHCVLDSAEAARDRAATLVLTAAPWKGAPDERDPRYFQAWQRVSVALQKAVRAWIPKQYFTSVERYEDRDAAYPMVVYEACRPCFGRPRTEFTYDAADQETLPAACRMIGRAMQSVLARAEKRLYEAGKPTLAHRYAPVWHQDILAAVRKRPKPLAGLLADEGVLINAVIDLGAGRSVEAVSRFSKAANAALRSVYGQDMRMLAVRALEEATKVLADFHASSTVGFRKTTT
jgi:hypothetical protein